MLRDPLESRSYMMVMIIIIADGDPPLVRERQHVEA